MMASPQSSEQPVSLPDFDDEPTVIQVRSEVFPDEPAPPSGGGR